MSGSGRIVGDSAGTLAAGIRALAALPGVGSAASRGSTRRHPSASSTSRSSATRSWRSTSRAGPIPRPARWPCSSPSSASSERSGGATRERWGPRELDLDLLVFGRHRIDVERPPEAALDDPSTTDRPRRPASARRGAAVRPGAARRSRPAPRPTRLGETVETARRAPSGRRRPQMRFGRSRPGPVERWQSAAPVSPRADAPATASHAPCRRRLRPGMRLRPAVR